MPSRVTVACAVLAVAGVCAVLAAAGEQQQLQQHALLSRLHKAKRTTRAHHRLQTSTTALPTETSPVDLLGTDWSKVDFTTHKATAPVTVTVKAGAVLYHASNMHVDFRTNPRNYQGFWLTPDLAQSIAGGVNKAKDGRETVFVHPFKPKRDLKLLALPACANAGIAYLNSVVATKETGLKPWSQPLMANPSQFNGLHEWLGPACKVLTKLGIDGWRSPWDQDEVMLCIDHQKELVAQQVRGCMFELLGPNVATRTYWNPDKSTPKRFDAQAMATVVFPKDVCGTDKDLFSYESHVRWADDLGLNSVEWTPLWWKALEQTALQRELANPTKHVAELVTHYRGKLIDTDSFTWFCGPVPPHDSKVDIKKK